MDELGIKYVGFYNYKKKLNRIERPITRLVAWEDSLEEATSSITRKALELYASVYAFHISSYDLNGKIPVKIKTYTFK